MSTPIRTPLRISYTAYQKHKDRNDDTWYCRVRERGQSAMDVNLHTKVKAQAEAYVMLRKSELQLFNAKVLTGEATDEDMAKLIRKNSPAIAQKTPSGSVVTLKVCLDAWEAQLRRTGHREATISTYMRALKVIAPDGAMLSDMTEDNLRRWLAKFDHLKSASRKNYSVALREFTKFCCRQYRIDRDLVDSFNFVKVEQVEKPYWTMNQIYHIIEAVECRDKVRQQVMKAYLWTLATTGCRQGEGYELRWSDLSDDNVLTFRAETTKTNRTRRVPLDWRIARMLRRLPHEGERIFHGIPDSQAGRFSILRKAVVKSGMPMGGLHTLRHAASVQIYSKTSDVKAAAQILGHSEETAMKTYIAARQAEQLRDTVDKVYSDEHMLPSPIQELAELDLL